MDTPTIPAPTPVFLLASTPRAWRLGRCAGLAIAAGLLVGCASSDRSLQTDGATAAAVAVDVAPAYMAVIDGVETPAPSLKMGDPATVARILDEGLNRNQVMDHLTYLCTEIGPRLTGSSNVDAAGHWAAAQFSAWGLQNVELREWGTIPVRFDRGPSTAKFIVQIETRERRRRGEPAPEVEPPAKIEDRVVREPAFTTLAWAAGTDGPRRGTVVRMPTNDEEFAEIVDKHPGAWVLIPPQTVASAQGIRGVRNLYSQRFTHRNELRAKVAKGELDPATLDVDDRLIFANISGFISSSRDERVWTSAAPGWRDMDPENLPQDVEVIVRLSDYDYLNSRIADGESVDAEFDLPHAFTPGPIPCYNVVAEIPGTTKPDEVIIISGHLDSWNGPGSMGTTDNGTGSSTTLETARILMAAGAKPERTIRFILWSGEEQGLLGARAYVEQIKDQHEKISAMFVDDGGTNTQGGLACTHDMAPMLAAATAPVNGLFFDSADGKPLNVNIRPSDRFQQSGGSDHAAFVAVGIPGFFWDEVGRAEYGYGWHTQHDRLDLAIPEYLKQSATCSAVTAYNLACAETMLPRWTPEPPPERPAPRERPAPAPSEGSSADPQPAATPTTPPAAGGR